MDHIILRMYETACAHNHSLTSAISSHARPCLAGAEEDECPTLALIDHIYLGHGTARGCTHMDINYCRGPLVQKWR